MVENNLNSNESSNDEKINNVVALNQLVGTIVDYYSFKNRLIENEDDSEKWEKSAGSEDDIIPNKIDQAISESFLSQLRKFIG